MWELPQSGVRSVGGHIIIIIGERKRPDCKNPDYPMYSPDCPEYSEPEED